MNYKEYRLEKSRLISIRKPSYLSPTSLGQWLKNKDEFFIKYLAEVRSPRLPQTQAMSVGSAFDARVKTYLSKVCFGKERWKFEELFEKQVEACNRDFALVAGERVWELYKGCGALQDLVTALGRSITEPVFETDMQKEVVMDLTNPETGLLFPGKVVLKGIPDLLFHTENCQVILDWKVNGYLSKASPRKGYVMCYPDRISHKDVFVDYHYGLPCVSGDFELLYEDWARQLCTYTWLLGQPLVNRTLMQIHQIAYNSEDTRKCRVAVHSGLCSEGFQKNLFAQYVDLWQKIQRSDFDADWVERMNAVAETMKGDSPDQELYRELTRSN